jgi:hypothetical protein
LPGRTPPLRVFRRGLLELRRRLRCRNKPEALLVP